MVLDTPQLCRYVSWRKNEIGASGIDGASRHSIIFRSGRVLGESDAPFRLDVLQARSAIGACARKNDPNGAPFSLLGERPHEEVNREMLPRRFAPRRQLKDAV
nr:hypothetical protein [Acidicapsa dinghuensis]